jgi:hypothetical protein
MGAGRKRVVRRTLPYPSPPEPNPGSSFFFVADADREMDPGSSPGMTVW